MSASRSATGVPRTPIRSARRGRPYRCRPPPAPTARSRCPLPCTHRVRARSSRCGRGRCRRSVPGRHRTRPVAAGGDRVPGGGGLDLVAGVLLGQHHRRQLRGAAVRRRPVGPIVPGGQGERQVSVSFMCPSLHPTSDIARSRSPGTGLPGAAHPASAVYAAHGSPHHAVHRRDGEPDSRDATVMSVDDRAFVLLHEWAHKYGPSSPSDLRDLLRCKRFCQAAGRGPGRRAGRVRRLHLRVDDRWGAVLDGVLTIALEFGTGVRAYRRIMDPMMPSPTDCAPDACTLPTAERPLRIAEFDDLFADRRLSVDRLDPDGPGGPPAPRTRRPRPGRRTWWHGSRCAAPSSTSPCRVPPGTAAWRWRCRTSTRGAGRLGASPESRSAMASRERRSALRRGRRGGRGERADVCATTNVAACSTRPSAPSVATASTRPTP